MKVAIKDPMKMRMWPHVFKYIGFVIAFAVLLSFFLALFRIIPRPFFKSYYEFFWPAIAAGLYIAAMSKEKREDEMLMAMRLRACFAGFMFGALWPIGSILFSFLPFFSDYYPQFDAAQLMTVALFFYHGIFRAMKRKARNEKHD